MLEIFAIITLAVCCLILLIYITVQKKRSAEEYNKLYIAYEDEKAKRATTKLCHQIFLEHYKEQKEKEIKMLREALRVSEEKRKELCTRLWEDENK